MVFGRIGEGEAHGHAGEIFQGALREGGDVCRVLVSLPAPALWSRATLAPKTHGGLTVAPVWKRKSLRAAQLAYASLGVPDANATLSVKSNIPVCRGLGSSTSDCLAAARAAGDACGCTMSQETLARIVCAAEGSSDSTMFAREAVLFRHREGTVREVLRGHVPLFDALVVDDNNTGVRTDALTRPVYGLAALDEFEALAQYLREAIEAGDVEAIARVATMSARINQRYHPKLHFDAVVDVAQQSGALGVAVAHSGNICALLYRADDNAALKLARTALRQSGLSASHELRTAALGSPCAARLSEFGDGRRGNAVAIGVFDAKHVADGVGEF